MQLVDGVKQPDHFKQSVIHGPKSAIHDYFLSPVAWFFYFYSGEERRY